MFRSVSGRLTAGMLSVTNFLRHSVKASTEVREHHLMKLFGAPLPYLMICGRSRYVHLDEASQPCPYEDAVSSGDILFLTLFHVQGFVSKALSLVGSVDFSGHGESESFFYCSCLQQPMYGREV